MVCEVARAGQRRAQAEDGRPLRPVRRVNVSGAVLLGNTEKPHKRLFVVRDGQPLGECLLCGRKFFRGEEGEYQRHAVEHAKRDLDDLRALAPSAAKKGTLFDPADVDIDLRNHWRGVRRDMAVENRTEVRPSETAERGN